MAVVAQPNHASFYDELVENEDFEAFKLRKATHAVLETGQLTPIIKEELRLLIQTRRLSLGQDELTVTFSPPNKDEKNYVDPEKALKRREQNRLAAKRFRQRWKLKYANIIKDLDKEQKRNVELKLKVERLTKLRNSMSESLMKLLSEKRIND